MAGETNRGGFTANKPVGEFANSDTTQCAASREDAIAEMEREANVRMKCYDRWVSEGKMTPEEARKRMSGIISAWHYLSDSDQAREALLADSATKAGK
jgi:hypothetical protein